MADSTNNYEGRAGGPPTPEEDSLKADPALPMISGAPWERAYPPVPAHTVRMPARPASGLQPQRLLAAFRRRWCLAVGLGLVCGLAAMAGAWRLIPPSKYVSGVTLHVKSYVPKIIFDTVEQRANSGAYKQTQIALLRSRLILGDALDVLEKEQKKHKKKPLLSVQGRLSAGEDPVEWLEKELQVRFLAGSDILEVSLTGDIPEDLPELVNAVVSSYMKRIVEKEKVARNARLKALKELWGGYQEELKARRKTLREFAAEAGGSDQKALALRQQYAAENLSIAQRERMTVSSEILKLNAELKVIQDEAASARAVAARGGRAIAPAQAGGAIGESDPTVRTLRERIARLDEKIHALRRIVKNPSDPSMLVPRRERDALQRELQQRLAEQKASKATGTVPGPAFAGSPADPAADVRKRLEVLKVYSKALQEDIDRLGGEARTAAVTTLDLQTEQDEVQLANATANKVGSEIEALEVELEAPQRIEVVDMAKLPRTKDDSKRRTTTGMAGLAGFALILAGVTLLEFRLGRIDSMQDVIRDLGIRLVGIVPAVPARAARPRAWFGSNAAKGSGRGELVESIDSIRTVLLHTSRIQSARVVMVTSAVKGEGKTSLSVQLATSLARAGLRTILIDSDLRMSALHRVFDVPGDTGFCEVLRGERTLESVTHSTLVEGLSLVPAGNCDSTALRLLAQEGARQVFGRALRDYDYVVVDSAPVLPLVDSLLLSQQVDAVIISVMWDVSRSSQVQSVCQRLRELDARVLGLVVNGMPRMGHAYTGYYG